MEKHKCKLCFRSFYNGRALGGHMRSHMMNLPIPPKPEEEPSPTPPLPPPIQLSVDAESASSSSSSSDEEGAEDEKLGAFYGLRENPKRSFRLVDPEFSFAVDAGSVVLQDRESETESSKNPTRRRSKRTRKSGMLELQYHHHHQKIQQQDEEEAIIINKIKFNKLISKTESWAEPEPVSSVSDTTTEEDVAFCLMMLSRDKWKKQEGQDEEEDHQLEDEQELEAEKSLEDSDESEELKSSRNRTRGKYKCETCKKVFRSYQALGGHRASHKKIKVSNPAYEPELVQENAGTTSTFRSLKKIHECPVCFRVFSSGQALGGHKRSHVTGSSATLVKSLTKFGDSLIDLNLPAPMEDDEISQIELSAVSDAEFVNPITH